MKNSDEFMSFDNDDDEMRHSGTFSSLNMTHSKQNNNIQQMKINETMCIKTTNTRQSEGKIYTK